MERKKSAAELIADFYDTVQDPITPYELVTEGQYKNHASNLEIVIDHNKKLYHSDFFIEHRITHEWALGGAPQSYIKGRRSCPTPRPLQTVWKFHYNDEALEQLWSLPSAGQMQLKKKSGYKETDKEKIKTLYWIKQYDSGELFKMARLFNKEIKG